MAVTKKTIERINADLAKVDISAFEQHRKVAGTSRASVGAVTPEQFAAIYPAVRAVLVAISAIWFLNPRFKAILKTLVTYLDALTGTV